VGRLKPADVVIICVGNGVEAEVLKVLQLDLDLVENYFLHHRQVGDQACYLLLLGLW